MQKQGQRWHEVGELLEISYIIKMIERIKTEVFHILEIGFDRKETGIFENLIKNTRDDLLPPGLDIHKLSDEIDKMIQQGDEDLLKHIIDF